jgi:type II secretory pathway pseudopilin PulG
MVVGTLSVLLAIILPTIKTVRNSALNKKAQTEATALAQAAIHYKNKYGFWPGQLQTKADDAVELRPAFKNLPADFVPAIISGPKSFTDSLQVTVEPVYLNENEVYQSFRQIGNKEGERFKSNPLNPKGIHFIDLAEENEPLRANFFDPWGRSYILFMGLNPHSTFTHTINFPNGGSQLVRVDNAIAFAFSYGQDGDRSTNYLYSAGVRK